MRYNIQKLINLIINILKEDTCTLWKESVFFVLLVLSFTLAGTCTNAQRGKKRITRERHLQGQEYLSSSAKGAKFPAANDRAQQTSRDCSYQTLIELHSSTGSHQPKTGNVT